MDVNLRNQGSRPTRSERMWGLGCCGTTKASSPRTRRRRDVSSREVTECGVFQCMGCIGEQQLTNVVCAVRLEKDAVGCRCLILTSPTRETLRRLSPKHTFSVRMFRVRRWTMMDWRRGCVRCTSRRFKEQRPPQCRPRVSMYCSVYCRSARSRGARPDSGWACKTCLLPLCGRPALMRNSRNLF